MSYLPIEDYGIIGDMHTVALVGKNGSIDWLCFPHFDSPSLFGAILDDRRGGRFRIAPLEHETVKQFYWPDTNVLVTRFFSADGVGETTDYMPVGTREDGRGYHQVIRRVKVVRGSMPFRMECRPAFNYARDAHEVRLTPEGACFDAPGLRIGLGSSLPLEREGPAVRAEFVLSENQTTVFVLGEAPEGAGCRDLIRAPEALEFFTRTVAFWRSWLSRCTYRGRWRERVYRSALALKLLSYDPTGAIIAAPTASLPQRIGGDRNWDERYSRVREAAFTIYAFLRIGFTEEALRFMEWLQNRSHELNPDDSLQVMYGIDGRHDLRESTLDHLEGYRGSSPVRVGHHAYNQLQLDIYGALMDAVYLFNKHATPVSYDLWRWLRRLVDWVCQHWKDPDQGIWGAATGERHFVYSKLMCWVAVDRGLRLADRRSFPADRGRWLRVRDEMYEEIMSRGWNDERGAFVQHYGSRALDAAALMMPLVLFVSPTDPRMVSTIDAIMESPMRGGLVSNGLVHRYGGDDSIPSDEGTFNVCTFWLVEALTRAGRRDEARLLFEQMLGYSNHLGLYGEETGPSGEMLGNFPQGFTHLALISAAYNLDRALGGEGHRV